MERNELIIDSFAGGGGASLGIAWATGRAPDIAINHDANAIAMHESNHPSTKHVREDVWKTDLKKLVGRRKVGLLWLSPRWQLQRFPVNSGNLVVVTHVAAAIVKANCLAELEV